MKSTESFEQGLRKDIEKRMRQAIGRLNAHMVDLDIECRRAEKAGDDRLRDERRELLYTFDSHVTYLRMAIGRLVVDGEHYISSLEKAALEAASKGPPRPKPPKPPPKPRAPVITAASHQLAPVQGTLALPMPRIIDGELEDGT